MVANTTYKCQLPHMYDLLKDIPEEDLPQGEKLTGFWKAVAWELSQLLKYGLNAKEPEIVLTNYRKAGSQYIWEFWVNDLSIVRKDEYNWHMQNVSQWMYAGGILLQNGSVSTHH